MPNQSPSAFFNEEKFLGEEKVREAVRTLIRYAGDDPSREGLQATPDRILRSYREMFRGYTDDPANHLTVFDNSDGCNEMILQRDIKFVSTCEHHMLPFMGHAHIAYIPNGKVIGVSKLIRILDVFSRRMQIQERLTEQVTQALDTHLQPKGSACIITAEHLCMVCRGVNRAGSRMVTSSLTGEFRKQEVRMELMGLVR